MMELATASRLLPQRQMAMPPADEAAWLYRHLKRRNAVLLATESPIYAEALALRGPDGMPPPPDPDDRISKRNWEQGFGAWKQELSLITGEMVLRNGDLRSARQMLHRSK